MRFASIGSPVVSRPAQSTETQAGAPEAGFTLFETLTAMLVLSIALVSLFQAHSHALKTATVAAEYARARILGQGLLAETLQGWSGKLVSKHGNDGAFAWSVDIVPERAAWAAIATKDNWNLHRVRVLVSWGDGRHIELDSMKLGRTNG